MIMAALKQSRNENLFSSANRESHILMTSVPNQQVSRTHDQDIQQEQVIFRTQIAGQMVRMWQDRE